MKIKAGLEEGYRQYVAPEPEAYAEHPGVDAYVGAIVRFANEWAEAMEAAMAEGKALEDVALDLSHEVDKRPGFGITGHMYGVAVYILSRFWEHGERLRVWHNARYGAGPDEVGVVDPATIVVTLPD